MRALLISTYELGRQPFGLASPAAWLRQEGWTVECVDAAKDRLEETSLTQADLIGVHLPMHTATRLARPVIEQARRLNRRAKICAYGLYAPLNAPWLRSLGVDHVLGGEFEADLTAVALGLAAGHAGQPPPTDSRYRSSGAGADELRPSENPDARHGGRLPRLQFLIPDRSGLPPLSRYATLHMPDGSRRVVGSTEASRGCKHLCRHCPVVPVYQGQFRAVQPHVVLADIAAQVAAGAGHITFGDPDFFNGPTHAMRIIEAMHAAHPQISFDVTIKVEHLLRHTELLPPLAASGCAFVMTAVESLDDRVLALLEKGHTRADFLRVVDACRAAGLTLVPTFVAFHPWVTLAGYCDLLGTIARLGLVDSVAPIQLAIRLLVPAGSRLLEVPELCRHLDAFDPATLSYPWKHPDPRVDALHRDVTTLVGTRLTANRRTLFEEIRTLAHARAALPPPPPLGGDALAVPYVNEPWYCCAEPTPHDLRLL